MRQRTRGDKAGLNLLQKGERYLTRPSLEELLPRNVLAAGAARDEAVWKSHTVYDYRLREIADHVGAHYPTISRAVKRIEQQRMLQCKT
jgi:hypothetical protein